MTQTDLFPRVATELATVFECTTAKILPETHIANIDKWDSMNHVKMLLQLERAFSIHFSGIEAAAFDTVEELVDLIRSKLSQEHS